MPSSDNTTPSGSPSPPASLDDLETYRPLFRRRKPPVSEPPVPCLHCAIKQMHCVYYQGNLRCQRCERNGDDFCVYQRQDLTRPEEPPTEEQQEQLEREDKKKKKKRAAATAAAAQQQQQPRHLWLPLPQRPRSEPLQCMVYSLDPELSQDRRRLLRVAAEILLLHQQQHMRYVYGTPVSGRDARNFVLPAWYGSEGWAENSGNPGHREENKVAAAQMSRRRGHESREVVGEDEAGLGGIEKERKLEPQGSGSLQLG